MNVIRVTCGELAPGEITRRIAEIVVREQWHPSVKPEDKLDEAECWYPAVDDR
ncbi:hypothetical protein [Alicyclobacillus dauci]|uniref:4-oxalocrotonate tautomerase n=1 Tax=Alicyclobacillus dauci TaxID=1475485 RepID=A0ABY6Z5X9_9BACL|nr:hypothetical protein [Alicyclobacillus dauci]WAH38155.1 hypothetical protein NZD86_06620 [Alicyclobacillus dauci]